MAGIYGNSAKDFGSSRVKKTEYDFSSIKTDTDSKRYYGFTIKEHYEQNARKTKVKNMSDFMALSIKQQKAREDRLLSEFGFQGNYEKKIKDFVTALTQIDANAVQAIYDIDLNQLFQDVGYKARNKISGEQLDAILNKIGKDLTWFIDDKNLKTFKDINMAVDDGRINNSAIAQAIKKLAMIPSGPNFIPQYKTKLSKELRPIITEAKKGLGEIAGEKILNYLLEDFKSKKKLNINFSGDKAIITGDFLTADGKQVKRDISLGSIGVQAKNYTIKDEAKSVPVSLHGGSISSIGEYLGNYKLFSADDIDNFIFNFVNIYNFSTSGGVNKDRDGTTTYAASSFDAYNEILSCIRQAAAIWFGTTLGLNNKGKKLFNSSTDSLTNVDFLFVGGKAIIPISAVLEYIQENVNSIDVHFKKVYTTDALKVYNTKIEALQKDRENNPNWGKTSGEHFNYPESIRRVGNKYGQKPAFVKADIKFMLILKDFKKYSSL